MTSWVDRYLAGERVEVWDEMLRSGPALRADREGWGAAQAVAAVTMRRARDGVEQLVELLTADGYVFRSQRPFAPAGAGVRDELDQLEAVVGAIPLSLRAWLEQVGSVNLVGEHPGWDFEFTDALVVQVEPEQILLAHADWEADRGTPFDTGDFRLDFAADFYHKTDVSGGEPRSLVVPNLAVDGEVEGERPAGMFLDHLRTAFAWAGFPGWDGPDPPGAPDPAVPPVIARWAGWLEPI